MSGKKHVLLEHSNVCIARGFNRVVVCPICYLDFCIQVEYLEPDCMVEVARETEACAHYVKVFVDDATNEEFGTFTTGEEES